VFFLELPLLLEQQHVRGPGGTGLGAYGLLISLYGCTNLLSNIVCGSRDLPARPQFQMFIGSMLSGIAILGFALIGGLPPSWQLTAYGTASALCGIGGPMKDIPVAVLRQTRLQPREIPAATRAMLAAASLGTLIAMLLLPVLLRYLSLAAMVACSGAVMAAIGLVGLLRHAGWREPADALHHSPARPDGTV
jgi:hypothetical protein